MDFEVLFHFVLFHFLIFLFLPGTYSKERVNGSGT